MATVSARSCHFRALSPCRGLRWVATALLHNCSTTRAYFEDGVGLILAETYAQPVRFDVPRRRWLGAASGSLGANCQSRIAWLRWWLARATARPARMRMLVVAAWGEGLGAHPRCQSVATLLNQRQAAVELRIVIR